MIMFLEYHEVIHSHSNQHSACPLQTHHLSSMCPSRTRSQECQPIQPIPHHSVVWMMSPLLFYPKELRMEHLSSILRYRRNHSHGIIHHLTCVYIS